MPGSPDLLFEMHAGLPRQGPGDDETTREAYEKVAPLLPDRPRILDIGCGTGAQTVELARCSGGDITAVDIHQPFLDELRARADDAGSLDRITTISRSVFDLEFEDGTFDLIWSEGAIFILGFERGLREWSRLVKASGCLVVSELTWLKANPPDEPRLFMEKEGAVVRTVDENFAAARALGYEAVGSLVAPEYGWRVNYYRHLEERFGPLKEKYSGDPDAIEQLDNASEEIRLHERYSDYYGYVFYILAR